MPRAHGARIFDSAVRHDVVVGYEGLVFADVDSSAVLRVEIHSSDFPADPESIKRMAFSGVDLAFDFSAVKLGERDFFLPLRLQVQYHIHLPQGTGLPRTAAPSVLGLTETFRNYGSASVRSTVDFSGAVKPSEPSIHSTITFGPSTPVENK